MGKEFSPTPSRSGRCRTQEFQARVIRAHGDGGTQHGRRLRPFPPSPRGRLARGWKSHPTGGPSCSRADTGWELFHRLNRDDACTYLQTRARQGFTVVQAVALAEMDGLTVPNARGDLPLVDKDDGGHLEIEVEHAASLGLVVALLRGWGRRVNDEPIFMAESVRRYGTGVRQRCRTTPSSECQPGAGVLHGHAARRGAAGPGSRPGIPPGRRRGSRDARRRHGSAPGPGGPPESTPPPG
ncbi:hypothetical protein DAETH_41890 (plasmid) [Deinococcus aetherius]|uniref:Apiosidase-like catalytic domain-containing protein n=1 Tax=Deinococcus aetherius TaxID=200252 RepID=A0ABM8AK76_9DEIO|nr:DUF4038 domain-containing protein [Deinococcus aetherius]BDP44220.1 hypothetical protein DAETH_41890 [Deinococcus aetherius]